VLCLWLLDIGNNTSMEPYRAFISDRLPKSQLARGFLTQSLFTGAGAVLANLSLFFLQKVITGTAGNGVPYWMYSCFWIGTVCILVTVLTAMTRTKELAEEPDRGRQPRLGRRRGTAARVRAGTTAEGAGGHCEGRGQDRLDRFADGWLARTLARQPAATGS
jgi:hypothetical protein